MQRICPFCGTGLEQEPVRPGEPPASDPCPTCGQQLDRPYAAAAFAQPGYAGQKPQPNPDSPAWEGEGNFLARIWRTIWQVLLHPVRTFSAPARPGLQWALSFGIILATLGGAAYIFWGRLLDWPSMHTGYEFWLLIFQPLSALVNIFILSAIIHFFLWLLRGARQGFSATFRVLAYSQASGLILLLPWVGMPVGVVWSLVVLIAGLAAAHGTGRGRAFMSLLLPFLLIIILLTLLGLALGLGLLMGSSKWASSLGL